MKFFSGWILSILGIVIIGAVIDLILPSGRMNKYIKSVFAAVTALVIILPLPNLVKNGCSTEGFIFNDNLQLQENYLDYVAKIKSNSMIKGLKETLKNDGITLGDVTIEGDFTLPSPILNKVKINLSQVVIVGQSEHIHKYELIQDKVSQYLSVSKEIIYCYEQ